MSMVLGTARQLVRDALSRWEEATLSGQAQNGSMLDYARELLASTGLVKTMEAIIRPPADGLERMGFPGAVEGLRILRQHNAGAAMARVADHLSVTELQAGYRGSKDATLARHYQVIWLLAQGRTVAETAQLTGFVPRLGSRSCWCATTSSGRPRWATGAGGTGPSRRS